MNNKWRPEGWENPYFEKPDDYDYDLEDDVYRWSNMAMCKKAYEAGADTMHKADVEWLIQRLIHDDRGYVFNMKDKEWQEFIKV